MSFNNSTRSASRTLFLLQLGEKKTIFFYGKMAYFFPRSKMADGHGRGTKMVLYAKMASTACRLIQYKRRNLATCHLCVAMILLCYLKREEEWRGITRDEEEWRKSKQYAGLCSICHLSVTDFLSKTFLIGIRIGRSSK